MIENVSMLTRSVGRRARAAGFAVARFAVARFAAAPFAVAAFAVVRLAVALFAVASLCLAAGSANAQSAAYPTRPIRIVTPFAAGGAIDVLCRVLAEKLAIQLGQPVLVEPKPGAATILGAEQVARAPADGYTLLITTSATHVSNVVFYSKLPYDAIKDFTPITQVSLGSVLLVGPGDAPFGDLREFAAWARQQKRAISFGSWGVGSSGHLFGERLKKDYGLNLNHVPYKGDQQAFADIRGGVLDVAFGSPVSAKPMVRAGYLKALGMTGPRRSPGMPDVPLFSEQGFAGFELAGYVAAYAPGGTPAPIIERLAKEFATVIRIPEVTAKLIDQGQDPIANTPQEFAAAYKEEFPKWEALIKASGATLQ